ncbi:MAG TPA: hypothetical protein VGJ26_01355 [Pirellulales bacterium]
MAQKTFEEINDVLAGRLVKPASFGDSAFVGVRTNPLLGTGALAAAGAGAAFRHGDLAQ